MDLVMPAADRHDARSRYNAIAELRDVGDRLRALLTRYDRLVAGVTDSRLPAPDLAGRLDWLNLQLADAAERLQELIMAEGRAARYRSCAPSLEATWPPSRFATARARARSR